MGGHGLHLFFVADLAGLGTVQHLLPGTSGQPLRKLPLLGFALAGLVFGLVLFVPHLVHPDWIDVRINRQSLAYEDTMFLDYLIPRWLTYLIYVLLLIHRP